MSRTSRNAWRSRSLRRAGEGDTLIGWYGGHPRGIKNSEWPRCSVCHNPMCHMAQLNAGPWLDLGPWARMTLFICHATGGRCEDWDPFKGSNRVLLQRAVDEALYDGPPTVRVYKRVPLTFNEPIDELELMMKVKEEGLSMSDALKSLRHDKLGGGAVWLQGDDTPRSRSGELPMRLLLQLTTDLVSFDITPGGMAYVFFDPNDASEKAAYILWQSGG